MKILLSKSHRIGYSWQRIPSPRNGSSHGGLRDLGSEITRMPPPQNRTSHGGLVEFVLSLPRIHPLAFHRGLCRVWCVGANRCILCGYRLHPMWKRPQLLKSFTYPKTSPYFALHSFMHIRRVFVLRSSKLPNKSDGGGGPGMPSDKSKFSFFFLSLQ